MLIRWNVILLVSIFCFPVGHSSSIDVATGRALDTNQSKSLHCHCKYVLKRVNCCYSTTSTTKMFYPNECKQANTSKTCMFSENVMHCVGISMNLHQHFYDNTSCTLPNALGHTKVYKSFICIARDFTSRQVINYTQECTYSCIINPKEVIDQFNPITFDWTCTFSTNTIWMKPNSNELSNEYNNLLTLSVTCKQNNMQMHTMPSMYGGKKMNMLTNYFPLRLFIVQRELKRVLFQNRNA